MLDRVKVRSQEFFEEFAELTRSVGTQSFYERMATLLARIAGCDRWLVVRYARYAAPDFIVNSSMTDDAIEFYLNGLYRVDPLLRITRAGPQTGIFTLSRLRTSDVENMYFDDLFRSAIIYDELAMLFSAPGRVCFAVCLDRSSRQFNDQEVDRFQMLFPAFEGLHDIHIERLLAPGHIATEGMWNIANQGTMVLDREHHEVFSNGVWQEFERKFSGNLVKKIHQSRGSGIISLNHETVLHWETLNKSFAIAPSGKICTIERRSPGYGAKNHSETVKSFAAKYDLSPREETIISLAMRGSPNSHIAKNLSISAGTVRNHKYRLYRKLGITTERELFRMFIRMLVGDDS